MSIQGTLLNAGQPNVVFIMADDLGYGDLSCYDGWIDTPHIDSIAKNGVRFTDYHSNGNVCSPTRAALMTGLYQQKVGIPFVVVAAEANQAHFAGLQDVENTWPEVMRAGGYATAIYGKWHLGYYPTYNPVRHGFDHFVGYVSGNVDFVSHIDQAGNADWWHDQVLTTESGYSTHLITEYAVRFIKTQAGKRPFFLYVPHEAPHYPYQGPNDPADRTVGGKFNNHGSRMDKREAYREMVMEMDKGVGKILSTLRRTGILANTIIVFCSDNGATTVGHNGGLRGTKGTDFEGGHRVPCVAQWQAGFPRGRVNDQLMMAMDWMPTVLAISGFGSDNGRRLDGRDLTEYITEARDPVERTVMWNDKTLRKGKWKLMLPQKQLKELSLFDLDEDLAESTNLAAKYPLVIEQMRVELERLSLNAKNNSTKQPTEPPE
ncbi:MAG: sulfatase-like hydrolase/transferase [Planctomycetota bacterium]|nr:sulfatase-like hydrolase/transferase [Planctomycetota bacterium]